MGVSSEVFIRKPIAWTLARVPFQPDRDPATREMGGEIISTKPSNLSAGH